MGNLLNSLVTVAESMRATQLAIETGGNNVGNAKTPGYAKQRLDLQAKRFEVNQGYAGGVEAGRLISGRKVFLEEGVQQQSHRSGRFSQQTVNLERVEPVFDVTAGSGIGGALDRLYQSFSAWSVNPNDTPLRQAVLERSRDLAQSFVFATASLATVKADSQGDLRSVVGRINSLGEQIHKYNTDVRSDVRRLDDPGLEAQLYSNLEELAGIVDFDVIRSQDGSINVNLGGQVPLTIGSGFYPLQTDFSGGAVAIRDARGAEITGKLQQGSLRALVDFQNDFLPGVSTDLDRLARTTADTVNATLAGGLDRNGVSPQTDLFRYDTALGAAASLTVNGLSADELAGAETAAPGGNGNALTLAALGSQRSIDGSTTSQFYGNLAGRAGRALANSRSDERAQSLLLAQSKNLRETESGVSLDEEAANLIVFQRQYEANAELIRILNSLTETTLNILR